MIALFQALPSEGPSLRFSTKLFRLGSAVQIKQKVSYPVSGTADAKAGVIVQRIDDTVGVDADAKLKGVVVVFNASDDDVQQVVPVAKGAAYTLSRVQARGSDPVVKKSTFTRASGTFNVPARTVAVFELRQA